MRKESINRNQATRMPEFFVQLATIVSILYINNAFFGFIKSIKALNAFCLLCMVLWFVVASKEPDFLRNCFKICTSLIVYTLFLIFLFFLSGAEIGSVLWQNLRNAFFSLICSFLCLYILPQDEKSKRKVLFFLLINIVLGCVYTIYRVQENPLLPRILARGSESVEAELAGMVSIAGIITYGGVYGMTLIFPSILYWISQENGIKKFIPTTISIVLFVTIFQAQFAIALIFVFIGTGLYLILYRGRSKNRYVLSWLFIFIAFIVAANWDSILSVIINADILPNALQQKAQELLLYSGREDISGTNLGTRSLYYAQSFEAIEQNNFVGKVFSNNASGAGHSEWEDMAANYGLIAPILVYLFFHKFTKIISEYLDDRTIVVFRIQLLSFLTIGFIDPIFHSRTMSYLIFLSPLILTMHQKTVLRHQR